MKLFAENEKELETLIHTMRIYSQDIGTKCDIKTCVMLIMKCGKRHMTEGYSGPFLKWTREELKQIDQRTRKLMTMHKALHSRNNVDKLYVSRKEGGRGLPSIEDSVDASIKRFEDYMEKRGERLITTTRNNTDLMGSNRMKITRKQKREKKPTIGAF